MLIQTRDVLVDHWVGPLVGEFYMERGYRIFTLISAVVPAS